jgi:heme exporter protein B
VSRPADRRPPRPGALAEILFILWKDLLIEWRGKARVVALATYALTLMLLFAFAIGPDNASLQDHAAAYLWLTALSASTLLLAQSFQVEVESGALEGLLLVPLRPMAIFYGKAVSNTLMLIGIEIIGLFVGVVIFDMHLSQPGPLLAVLALGGAGIAAPGTVYAALTARLSAQHVVLPVLLFPLVVPTTLAAVKATSLLLHGDPMGDLSSWLQLLVAVDVVYWAMGGPLFDYLVQDP